ncbi:hypothetical protein Glove_349g34 [Diversispora epigaea]|uniref:Uncharacterized protein n=1 Tax=Diversispora epigaea TaxID=1348612 RepID=A0A397HLF7_9GLOM|nr:hypothetical protein Glove_349g34 [Diversispora epigaea]
MNLSTSVKELQFKKVTNITYKVHRALNTPLISDVEILKPSNTKENNIKLVFSDLKNGEQECEVIFCTVHLL